MYYFRYNQLSDKRRKRCSQRFLIAQKKVTSLKERRDLIDTNPILQSKTLPGITQKTEDRHRIFFMPFDRVFLESL